MTGETKMIGPHSPGFGRRGLIAGGLAGTAALLGAPAGLRAQPTPAAGQPAAGGQSAVIDVNRARTDPIPIAIPDMGAGAGGDAGRLGHDIAQVVTDDLARSGLFRPIAQAAATQASGPAGDVPNFQSWRAIGAQALVTGKVEGAGGGGVRVEFRLWDVLPQQQIQGTA